MPINETIVTEAIIRTYTERFLKCLNLDVAIVGGGPAGLVAAKILAEKGASTALFERKLSIGGGMWGGVVPPPSAEAPGYGWYNPPEADKPR